MKNTWDWDVPCRIAIQLLNMLFAKISDGDTEISFSFEKLQLK